MRSRRGSLPLAWTIALALALKLALLLWLWHSFFAAPQASHMRMPTAQVEQRLLDIQSSPSLPTKANHDSH
jgi:hypothetical protein